MTFYSWLRRQTERDDRVGDVARDVVADHDDSGVIQQCEHPLRATSRRGIRDHMIHAHFACDDALESLDAAYEEYRRAA